MCMPLRHVNGRSPNGMDGACVEGVNGLWACRCGGIPCVSLDKSVGLEAAFMGPT